MKSWRTAAKIALREARASRGRFVFVLAGVAAGVAALTGVQGFSQSFRAMLLREARTMMAADLSVRTFAPPSPAQLRAVESLARRDVDMTLVTETLSMVSSRAAPEPLLASVKAVDPAKFPFYGEIVLDPPGQIAETLDARSVIISDDLRVRLNLGAGDTLRLGTADLRVAGVVVTEPDRMSGSFNVGPRLMVSRAALERSGLMALGSRGSHRLLFRLRPGAPGVATVQRELAAAFPEGLVVDFREVNPNIARGLDRATTFLSLVSLIALIVGAIGVGSAMQAHVQQKMDSIAVMKSIGARSSQVVRIYLLQTLLLGVVGGGAGIALGALVQRVFPDLIGRYSHLRPEVGISGASVAQGLAIGVLTTLLFTLPSLLAVRSVRPALILRRDMAEARPHWRARLRASRTPALTALAILVVIGALAAWLAGGPLPAALRIGSAFAAGLAASLAVLSAIAFGLMRALRGIVRARALRLSSLTRHAVANLYRPGSQAQAVLTTLGVGVMFTTTVYLVQHSVLAEIARTAPPNMPNVFLLDIAPAQTAPLMDLVRKQAGLERAPELISTVSSRMVRVDGIALGDLKLAPGWSRRYRSPRAVTSFAQPPEATRVLQGRWWNGADQGVFVSVGETAARVLNLKPGSIIEWDIFGRNVSARVAAVHRSEGQRLASMVEFILSPGVLDGMPAVNYAGLRVRTAQVPQIQRAVYASFPTVTIINVADILDRVQEVVDQIAVVVRFLSLFTVAAAAIILMSSIAGTRFRRVREVAVLKTLGATRRRIARMFSTEFLILGGVAGLMGGAMAAVFSNLLLRRFFDAPLRFEWSALAVATLASALIAATAGWMASFRILREKPLEILRRDY